MVERLTMRLPDASLEEVKQLAAEAEGMLLAYTGRMTLPGALETAMLQLAVVLHNRRGIEGQTAHSEGGVSQNMEGIPREILLQAAPYRLARVVKMNAYETAGTGETECADLSVDCWAG